jgi:DNA-directed RNA polymerase subunit beta'
MPFYNETIDKKKITGIIGKSYKDCGNFKTVSFLDQLKDLGFGFAYKSGLSIAIADIHIPEQKAELLAKADAIVEENEYQQSQLTTHSYKQIQNLNLLVHQEKKPS